ncbi:MAG: histidine kinase [Acidobacteriia bacterium]|nr:histidine kinase [Terriglobia bacterium]
MRDRAGKLALHSLLIWGGWSLYAIFSASQNFLSRAYSAPTDWKPAFRYAMLDSYVWAAFTPVVLYVAGRLVVRRGNWWWALPLLFVAGLIFAALHLFTFVQLLPWIGYRNNLRAVQSVVMAKLHSDVLTCWALFGIRHAMEYYRQLRIRELKASQLEAKLALSQLEVLKMQLQPHFLFNTLHAISALMYRNLEGADRMIARLSDFLRLTLDSAGVQEVTLKREMEYLDKYLEIEQVRFGERLEVRRAIDPDTLDLLLPNLVLQPLVENAVRHGIAPRAGGGRIEVAARVDRGKLVVEVLDDGPGPTGEIREGLGLSNTRARLEQLYGKECRLELSGAPHGGFLAQLIIPAHSESLHASPDHRR